MKGAMLLIPAVLMLVGCGHVDEPVVISHDVPSVIEPGRVGQIGEDGFPILVGPEYQRRVPLKGSVDRAQTAKNLEDLAASRQVSAARVPAIPQSSARNLQSEAKTHSEQVLQQIKNYCTKDASGNVICQTDSNAAN